MGFCSAGVPCLCSPDSIASLQRSEAMPTQSSGPTMVNFLTAASAAVLPLLAAAAAAAAAAANLDAMVAPTPGEEVLWTPQWRFRSFCCCYVLAEATAQRLCRANPS